MARLLRLRATIFLALTPILPTSHPNLRINLVNVETGTVIGGEGFRWLSVQG